KCPLFLGNSMLFSGILRIDFFDLYSEKISLRTFQNFQELLDSLTGLANDWAKNNSLEIKLDPQIIYSIILNLMPQKQFPNIPLTLKPSRDIFLESIASHFSLMCCPGSIDTDRG